jgi:hypothetical protein
VLVRAGLAGIAVALLGGWVTTQYVGVHLMSLLAPLLVGMAASWATSAAAGRPGPPLRHLVVGEAVTVAVLGVALGFALTPGGKSPLHPAGQVVPPYLAAALGVLVWPLLFATPTHRRRAADGQGVEGTD